MASPTRSEPPAESAATTAGPRERILRTAYDLFCREGVHAVGIDRIVADAGVAKMSLYRHFHSKEELVLEVIELREQLWTRGWLEREVEQRADTPEGKLLAIFDVFGDWFRHEDYEGCLFINSLLETHDRTGLIGSACVKRLATVRSLVRIWSEEAGIPDPDRCARQWQILMLGSIVAAAGGDNQAARRTREIATCLLHERGRT
jgi:AcrR family transcriptional regulator